MSNFDLPALFRVVVLFTLSVATLALMGCSASIGSFYATGSHPFGTLAVKGTIGPVEALHAPTTQRGANDLYMAGVYPSIGTGIKATVGAGWAWWRDWDCTNNPNDCSHNWVNGLTAGVGLTYTHAPLRLDLRYQVFTNAPFNGALLFTAGVTP